MTRKTLSAPFAWLLVALLLLGGTLNGVVAQTPEASPVASPVATTESWNGIQIADMDLSVDPGDDFFRFANGGWIDRSEIPPDSPTWGAFEEVAELVDGQLAGIMAGFDSDPTTAEGKARTIHDQYLDMETRDAQGVTPLEPILEQTAAIASVEDGLDFQMIAGNYQIDGLFEVYSVPSEGDATVEIANLWGPILSLPSEDYYTEDEENAAIQEVWIDLTTQMLVELGYSEDEAATAAAAVIAFETELVGIKTPDAELFSDPTLLANPRTIDELNEIIPGIDWQTFVEVSALPDDNASINLNDLPYFEALQGVVDAADPNVLRYLFDTQLVWTYAPYLTTEIGDLYFSLIMELYGVTERAPIEERAVTSAKTWFPDALSQAYVAEYFPPDSKAAIEELVDNLIAAFRIRIGNLDWMSEETKAKAIEKLDLMSVGVGYPDSFKTYEDVEVGDSLVGTILNAWEAQNAEDLGAAGGPVDRTEWFMNAFEVNAGYDPSRNMMIFPAAILQAPYFDADADLASNYGSIGAVIGHEITHGFDVSGSQFDGYGNLVSWWTEEDFEAFSALNDEVIAQYSAIEFLPGLMVDGELTVGENAADMGGVNIAYDALLIALDGQGHSLNAEEMETPWFLTQQQRFFIAFSTSWREIGTPEFYETLVASNVHAPAPVRAVQPLRNTDGFFTAFNIGEGDAEYLPPEDRIVIW
ncbi:MAG TPA: M13 family metallopeptidase [Thermomicrobiales bacterium]|nr:M13 family metallopeptidase [Thermomicrobiales bacterium]